MKWLRLVAVFILIICLTSPVQISAAETILLRNQSAELDVQDVDNDGDPDVLTFQMDFSGDDNLDVVHVVDRGDDMERSNRPKKMINYRNDLLIYDSGNDGNAEVIITFEKRGTTRPWYAELYDTGNVEFDLEYEITNDPVPKDITNDSVPITGSALRHVYSGSPTLTISSQTPWIHEGSVSYNIQIICHRKHVRCSFDDAPRHKATITVVDGNQDGTPEYEMRQIDLLEGREANHESELMVNQGTEETLDADDGIIWPYIGTDRFNHYTGSSEIPIQVDWKNGMISTVGEFVSSRSDEDNYFIYSQERIDRNSINPPSFEYPFSFHDLAGDNDGTPELAVRVVAFPRGRSGKITLQIPKHLPFDFAYSRYSWDQNNDGRWDYKLGFVGPNGYTNVDRVGPYQLRKPTYNQVPEWVRSQRWSGVSFVESRNGIKGSEGIYEGDFGRQAQRRIMGLETYSPPIRNHTSQGYRLEVNGQYNSQPRLYYSPVDKKLHLYNFKYGYWNRTDAPNLQYRNIDSDPYIDWWAENRTAGKRWLIAENDWLVYATEKSLLFKSVSVEHSAFVARPPTTSEEWKTFGEQLPNESNSSFDLHATFHRYDADPVKVTNATFDGYVLTNDGFRVFATLSSVSSAKGNTSMTLPDREKVVFVVRDGNETIHAVRATPPALSITNASISGRSVTPLERNTVSVQVRNDGWQTAKNVTVELTDGQTTITKKTVTVIGKRTEMVKLAWWPSSSQEDVMIIIRSQGNATTKERVDINTTHQNSPSILDRYRIANPGVYITISILLTVIVSVILTVRQAIS